MRLTSILVGVLLVAIIATPALAGPGKGRAEKPQAQDVEKQIQQLTKELKKLEKQLKKAQAARGAAEKAVAPAESSRRARAEQQRRMAEARRQLAELLSERAAPPARRGPEAVRAVGAPKAPKVIRAPKGPAAEAPQPHRRRPPPAQSDRAPQWAHALRSLQVENKKLAARVQALERQIRRVGAAIGKLSGPEHAARARPERAARAHRTESRQPMSVEARLARLERAVRALVAKERRGGRQARGMRGRSGQRGPRWMQRGRGQGGKRGMHGMRGGAKSHRQVGRQARQGPCPHCAAGARGMGSGDGPGRRGRQDAHRDGPAWSRMLPGENRTHHPATSPHRPDGPPWGFGRRGGRMGGRAMQRGRGHPDGACPSCGG